MPKLKPTIFNLLLFFLVLSCSNDSVENTDIEVITPLEYFEELNVSYGSDTNQTFDIFLPQGRTMTTKVIILVHGGLVGWRQS